MDKPKCFICDHHHWYSEECPDEVKVSSSQQREPEVDPGAVESTDNVVSPDTLRKQVWRAKNRERYNAYQKAYMSTYRKGSKQ